MAGWIATAPIACSLSRERNREATCFLLERGVTVLAPRCCSCGHRFDPPHLAGARFPVALAVFEPRGASAAGPPETRLFVGNKVLVARVGAALSAMLDQSITYVGERVLIGTVRGRSGRPLSLIFCLACGENISSHLDGAGESHYTWDWLVEFVPRRIIARLMARLVARKTEFPTLKALPRPLEI